MNSGSLWFTLATVGLALLSASPSSEAATRNYLAFPKNFKWCVATAGHQIEGYNFNSDWWDWEQIPGKIKGGHKSNAACDHWNRVEEDTQLMKDINVKQYRFSVEWAKIEPEEGRIDPEAVLHYQMEVETLRKAGIEPMITLHHFVMPRWIREKGGWEWEGSAEAFGKYADFVYRNIGVGVRDWVTLNEPMVHLLGGYVAALTPPGVSAPPAKGPFGALEKPLLGALRAHAAAYHAVHKAARELNQSVRVGVAHHLRVFDPDSRFNPLDAFAAHQLDQGNNWLFMSAMETGKVNFNFPFIVNIQAEIPGLANTQDFIGVNYYTRDMVSVSLSGNLNIELLVNETSPRTDMGWEIYPEGFYKLLREVARRFPGKAVVVTENGLADHHDKQRKKFLEDHLTQIHRAIRDGVPIEGYCHWSLMDNFEWIEGFEPRFGLYAMDEATPDGYVSQKRTLRESGKLFSEIADKNGFWVEAPKPKPWPKWLWDLIGQRE